MIDFSDYIKELGKLVSFNTVLSAPEENAPFGKETKAALEYFLSLASSFGFETINYDNYIGEAVFGEGEEIGVIGHLDVVPTGDGWLTDPFTLTFKNGEYYGRGVSDDKGPLLMCLYAMKALKDSGVKPKVKFRLIAGCNEETGWKDVEYMKKVATFPKLGFSPDGDFPLSYAEKGVYIVKFYLPALKNFSRLSGGTVINAVCDRAEAYAADGGINEPLILKHRLMLGENGKITSVGKAAHGSHPEMGVNALDALFAYFIDVGENVKTFYDCVIQDETGLRNLKNEQGGVTLSPDIIEEKDGEIVVSCDMRVPAPFTYDDVKPYLVKTGLKFTAEEKHPPFMAEKYCPFSEALVKAYAEVTGEADAKPFPMGGSTFARVFEKGYSFGVDSLMGYVANMHQANEKMDEATMKKAIEIYEKAFFNLAKGI